MSYTTLSNSPDLLTVKDFCKIFHVGRNFVSKLINENLIDAHFVGNKWLITKEDAIEYLEHV